MHNAKQLRFQISQLRQDKVAYAVESIAVFIFSLFASAFLPNLLMQYVFTDPNITKLPAAVEYTPVLAFVAAMVFFFYVMVGNIGRLSQIKKLEKKLEEVSLSCDDCDCDEDHHHHDAEVSTSSESIGVLAEKMKAAKKKKSK